MIEEKYLSLGSVVMLKKGTHKVMIVGYCPTLTTKDNKTVEYDYFGCIYPEGIFGADYLLSFNHDDIKEFYGNGYSSDEEKNYRKLLKEKMSKVKNNTFDAKDFDELYGKIIQEGQKND